MEKYNPSDLSNIKLVKVIVKLSFRVGQNNEREEINVLHKGNVYMLLEEFMARFSDRPDERQIMIGLINRSKNLGEKSEKSGVDIIDPEGVLESIIKEGLKEMGELND